MKKKIIPFNLETAKKIQAGEIDGKIETREGMIARILCTDVQDDLYPIAAVAMVRHSGQERVRSYTLGGFLYSDEHESNFDLVLEVPDDEPQFKPFDKVLVRDSDDEEWEASHFSHSRIYEGKIEFIANNARWLQCIPYEGHEYLVGTTNKPKEE